MRPLVAASFALWAFAAVAAELSPESVAKIEHEQQKAFDDIDKKHGNKKPSELSGDERKEIINERAAAERAVLEKHGVEAKDYTRYTAKMNLDDRAATKAAGEKLKKEEAEKAAAKAKAGKAEAKEVQIQRGFSDSNPVVLEEKEGAEPVVEKSLPADAQADQDAAKSLTDSSSEQAPEPAPAPTKGKSRKK